MSDRRERIDADQEELYGYPGESPAPPAPEGDLASIEQQLEYVISAARMAGSFSDRPVLRERALGNTKAELLRLLRAAPPGAATGLAREVLDVRVDVIGYGEMGHAKLFDAATP